jgi:hypothetical protein
MPTGLIVCGYDLLFFANKNRRRRTYSDLSDPQVASQLSNLPDRTDSQVDKLLSTTINYLLLAQGQSDVETRLLAEEILVSVVKSVPGKSIISTSFIRT